MSKLSDFVRKSPLVAGGVAAALIAVAGVAAAAPEPAATAATQAAPAATGGGVAQVTSASGRVMINRGTEYVPAKPGMPLEPGDRVVVLEGGSVQYAYTDGCAQKVESASIATVQTVSAASPCAAQSQQVAKSSAPQAAAESPAPQAPAAATGGTVAGSGLSDRWYGVISAVAVAAPAVVLATTDSNNEPLSP